MKSYISTANVTSRVIIPEEQLMGSKNSVP